MLHRNGVSSSCFLSFLAFAAALAISSSALAVETVRVDASSGAPRILVDGRPVRARIFWGAHGPGLLPVEGAGKVYSFEFSPNQDEPSGATMHFRFGQVPGDVFLDDIRCVDLTTGKDAFPPTDFEQGMAGFQKSWSIWPPKASTVTTNVEPGRGQNGSAALHIALEKMAGGQRPDFHIYHKANIGLLRSHRYRVTFWASVTPARNFSIAFYRPGASYQFLGGPNNNPFRQQIELAADAGVNLISFPVSLVWTKPGEKPDWSAVDGICQEVLDVNPKALLLLRVGMWPPAWWCDAHPDDRMVWDRKVTCKPDGCVASPVYRREAGEHLAALIAHVEEKFGSHVAGYHPAGQNTDEWFYQNTWGPALNGYSKAELTAWREWLKKRYHDDARLQAAWRDPKASLDTVVVPSPKARRASPAGVLRDPTAERPVIDFTVFQQEMMSDCVRSLAHVAREATHGRKLVVFFYGYLFEFSGVANGPGTAGHYAVRRVASSPDIDIMCSPISYFDRGMGQSAPAMTAAESVTMAGKMWLYEDDTATYLSLGQAPGWNCRVDTVEETNAELVRNVAECAVRNFGTWWMDLGAIGWFNDPKMWAEMARLRAIDEPMLQTPTPFRPEVAAVVDEASMMRVSPAGAPVSSLCVGQARRPLGRMGSPYGQYLQDDVIAGRVNAKLLVFLSSWSLSPEQRRQLLAASPSSLKVWCYAPGYQTESGVTLDGVSELTGFKMKKLPASVMAWAVPTEAGRKFGLTEAFGVKRPFVPLLAVTDAKPDEILATYPDGSAAVALRTTAGGPSLFVGVPGLTSELLRAAARKAGVHLFTQTDCNVYANGPFVALHGAQDGTLELDVGRPGDVCDLLSGQNLGKGPKITLPLKKGETRVLVVR